MEIQFMFEGLHGHMYGKSASVLRIHVVHRVEILSLEHRKLWRNPEG
jgi:hypothetical protein